MQCGTPWSQHGTACYLRPSPTVPSGTIEPGNRLPTHAEVDAYFWEQFRVKGDGTYADALWATLIKFGPRFAGGA